MIDAFSIQTLIIGKKTGGGLFSNDVQLLEIERLKLT